LDHADAVHLSSERSGATTRYTTRAVLEAEGYVWRAAEGLATSAGHGLIEAQRAGTLESAQHEGISREQARAFRHATGDEGLAIIDGLAGAGKSRTTAAVRDAYEAAGYRVIGTAWTHRVVQDMEKNGFEHTSTVKRELFMLANGREQWDSKTVVIVDEAAMLDTAHMAMLTAYAQEAGAKLILVGDDRQLASIERGGMFGVLKDRYGAATLTEINRQAAGDDRRASEYFAEGKFHDALGIYQGKGGIHWTRTQVEARAELLDSYRHDVAAAPDKSRFIFAYTNVDVAELNRGAREVHRALGQLGADHEIDSADGRANFAAGDRIQFSKNDKKLGIYNGTTGTVHDIEGSRVTVAIDGGKTASFDSREYQSFRHGYAGTIYKGQGATVDQSYLYHSEHWRSAASYVGMTRHREKAELFAATNTAAGIDQLARQMSRVDEGKRYAASFFHHRQEIGPVRPLTADQILARFADKGFEREQQQQQQQDERQVKRRAGDMGYSHGNYASQSRAALREHRRQRRPYQQDNQRMDQQDDLDEQRKRRAAWTPDEAMMPEARKTQEPAAERPERPQEPANQNDPPTAEEKEASRLQEPFAEREATPFQPSEQQPGRYDPLKREDMTLEAIRQDSWNAVALDMPENPDPDLLFEIAATARDMRHTLNERAGEAETPEQQALWSGFAEAASARQKEAESRILSQENEPITEKSIDYDPWTAVYRPIPPDADASLLQHAHDAAMQCAGAVAGEPEPDQNAFAPDLLGADQTREQNFERAVRRLDELDGRMREIAPAELSPDELAERVRRIIDDPTREADEADPRILEALQAHREADQATQPAAPEEEEREAAPSQEAEPESSAAKEAKAVDAEIGDQEMTADQQDRYSRWTGEKLGPATGPAHETGRSQGDAGGGGQSR
jgi:hypothetical protein